MSPDTGGTPAGAGPPDASRAVAYRSLAVSVVTLALAYGVWYAYSVFLVALLRDFGWSRSVLAGAFSVFTLVNGATNPILGVLSDRVGPRSVIATGGVILAGALWLDSLVQTPWQLYLAFGALTAVGVATSGWTPAVVLVQRHFSQRVGLALGIAGAGIGLGILVVVPLCQVLIDAFGWRWAFRAMAILCAVWIVPGTLLGLRDARGAPVASAAPAPGPAPAGSPGTGLTLAVALGTLPFWLIASAKLFGNICSQALHVHQAAFLVDHGLTPMVAASVVSVVGGASIVGKTGGGWLSDILRRESVYVLGMVAMILSVGVLLATGAWPSSWLAYGYAVLFGAGYSVTASLIPAMVSDRFRGRSFGSIFGVAQIGSSIGSALGAWLAGWLFDVTGSYTLPFALAAVAAVIAGFAGWAARLPAREPAPAAVASAPAS